MPLNCGASPVGPEDDMMMPGMKSMYIIVLLFAPMPLGRLTHTTVFVAVLLGFDSTQACSVLPVAAGPVVNSTLFQVGFMYDW